MTSYGSQAHYVRPTPGFDIKPYHVEVFPIGAAVCNAHGFNVTSFAYDRSTRPRGYYSPFAGHKFISKYYAEILCRLWNESE